MFVAIRFIISELKHALSSTNSLS